MLVKLAAIFFSMILVNNYVLVKFYGICPFLGVSKKLDSAVGMSGAVIFVMFMATAVTFPIQIFILDPAGLSYLQTIVFILVIAVLVQFIEIFLKKYCCTVQFSGRLSAPDHHQLLRAGCDHSGRGRLRRRCGCTRLRLRLHRGSDLRHRRRLRLYAGHGHVQRRA